MSAKLPTKAKPIEHVQFIKYKNKQKQKQKQKRINTTRPQTQTEISNRRIKQSDNIADNNSHNNNNIKLY